MKLLILGAGGMLGHVLFSELKKHHQVWGTVRSRPWTPELRTGFTISAQKSDLNKLEELIKEIQPDVVLNCIGIIKQLKESKDSIPSLEVNSLIPHLVAEICQRNGSRFVHFSTDCVFLGTKGNYREDDTADSRDLYGLSKYMGEVSGPHCLTLRTSIIGHELDSNVSLVDWFLTQKDECLGFHKAIYTGFPTVEIASLLNEKILPAFVKDEISGLYQLSSDPINKYELLKLIAKVYGKTITINPSEKIVIDRSLNSDLLRAKLNFIPKKWDVLIQEMHTQFIQSNLYKHKDYIL